MKARLARRLICCDIGSRTLEELLRSWFAVTNDSLGSMRATGVWGAESGMTEA